MVLEGYRGGPVEWNGGTVYDPQTGMGSTDLRLHLTSPIRFRSKAAAGFCAARKPGGACATRGRADKTRSIHSEIAPARLDQAAASKVNALRIMFTGSPSSDSGR